MTLSLTQLFRQDIMNANREITDSAVVICRDLWRRGTVLWL